MHAMVMALALSASQGTADEVVQKAFADSPELRAAPESASSPGSKMLGWGLALVTVCAVAAMALKRRGQKSVAGFAEVAQNVSVGPKRSLLVVDFAGKRMLVGSTEAGFTVLSSEVIAARPTEFDALMQQASAGTKEAEA